MRERLAWAAGLFDGEGNVRARKIDRRPVLRINQVDREVLDRFVEAIGFGRVIGPYGPYVGQYGRQPQFALTYFGFEHVQAVIAMLWTWLGPVKRLQAANALAASRTPK